MAYTRPPTNLPEWVAPQPLPDDPLSARLIDISGWHVEARCPKCTASVVYPLRLAAAKAGWDMTLAAFISRLKCSKCGARPVTVRLMGDQIGDVCVGRPTDPNVVIVELEVPGRPKPAA